MESGLRGEFADLLRSLRVAAGLSQEELADRAGLSVRTLSDLERGLHRAPHRDTLVRLAAAMALASEDQENLLLAGRKGSHRLLRASAPKASAMDADEVSLESPVDLPVWLTSFVGREAELDQVSRLVRQTRLLTVYGTGGAGKTRLAVQVATRVRDDFPDGTFFVPLAPIREPDLVPATIAQVLGVAEAHDGTPLDTLVERLRTTHALLILDNFEQVLHAAEQIASLVKQCTHLHLLVTSRAVLRVSGEHAYHLSNLNSEEAVRLFVDRARAARSDFNVTRENEEVLVDVCTALDGLPLAIELAAARTRLLSPKAIAARLAAKRLPLLSIAASDVPQRHQALAKAIEWSYELLTPEQQKLFRRLAVFVGGWSLEAAEAICGPRSIGDGAGLSLLDDVSSLLDQSLIHLQVQLDTSADTRCGLLETIREYALDRLSESGELDAIGRRHADYFLEFAQHAAPYLRGSQQTEWLSRLDRDHDNLRAALRFYLNHGNVDESLRLAGALWRLWYMRGYIAEGRERLDEVLELSAAERTSTRALALNGAGNLAYRQGDYVRARSLHEQSLEIKRELGDRAGIASSLDNLGLIARDQGDYPKARTLHEEGLAIRRELNDRVNIAPSLNNLGLVAREQTDLALARSLHQESLAVYRELGDRAGIASALENLGDLSREQGDYDRARSLLEECLAISRQVGARYLVAQTLNDLGLTRRAQGDPVEARAAFDESLAVFRELGDRSGVASALENLGDLARERGDYDAAHADLAESLAISRELGNSVAIANSLSDLGMLALSEGDHESGRRLLEQSIRMNGARGHRIGIVRALERLASVASSRGLGIVTLNLAGAAASARALLGVPLAPAEQVQVDRNVTAARTLLAEADATTAWLNGAAMSLDQAVEYALEAQGVASG